MRGHEAIVSLRRKGKRPDVVFIDLDCPASALKHSVNATVEIAPGEPLQRLDWRWAIGLRISLTGRDAGRVREAARLLSEAGAERVISSCIEPVGTDAEWPAFRCVWIEDSAKDDASGERAA